MLHWVTPLVSTVSWLPPLTSLPVILFSHPIPATGRLTRTLISPESCNQHSLYSRHLLSGWETFPAQNLQLHTHPIPDFPCSLLYYNFYLPFVHKISWIKLLYIFVYFIISSQGAAIFSLFCSLLYTQGQEMEYSKHLKINILNESSHECPIFYNLLWKFGAIIKIVTFPSCDRSEAAFSKT